MFSRSVWNRCPPPLGRGATAASSPHSASPFPNQSLSPLGLALACLTPPPPDAARPPRRAPPPAARGLAGRCSAARRLAGRRKGDPPRGGSLAAARGTRPGRRPPPPPRAGTAPFTRPRLLRPFPPPPTTTASIPAASAAAAAVESPSGVGDANECAQRLRERRGCYVCPRAGKQVAARALSC